jgi:membrane protease YdiL (CAAX protease family)
LNASSLLLTPARRLRVPWRILLFILSLIPSLVVAAAAEAIAMRIASALGYRILVVGWSAALALLLSHFFMLKWVEGKSWDFVWLERAAARPLSLIIGTLHGLLAIAIPSAALLAAGELQIVPATPGSSLAAAGISFARLLPAAFSEELLLRGYVFAVLREAIGWRMTLIATSLVFGLLHIPNPSADGQAILIVMLAGLFLGAVMLVTRSLYAATMAHFAWNWFMAAGLHSPVSGLPVDSPDYRVIDSGPDWLTGGGWGPEGGVAAALGMFAALIYLNARLLRRTER